MMFLLNVSARCSDPGLAVILATIKKFMNILWIIGPILAIIGGVMALIKLLTNPEEKKYKNLFKNMLIALVILFLLPAIVNAVMKLMDGNFDFATCWNQAEVISEANNGKAHYIDPNKVSKRINIEPSMYR